MEDEDKDLFEMEEEYNRWLMQMYVEALLKQGGKEESDE